MARACSGSFANGPLPLARVYLLERFKPAAEDQPPIQVIPLQESEAAFQLIRMTFSIRLARAAGLIRAIVPFLAQAAQQIPVYRLRYPSGLARIGAVYQELGLDW